MIVEKLPACLKIEDGRLFGCLLNIETTVKGIWDQPFIQHYTRHGLGHSERIYQMIGHLLDEHKGILNKHGLVYGKDIFQNAIKEIESKKK